MKAELASLEIKINRAIKALPAPPDALPEAKVRSLQSLQTSLATLESAEDCCDKESELQGAVERLKDEIQLELFDNRTNDIADTDEWVQKSVNLQKDTVFLAQDIAGARDICNTKKREIGYKIYSLQRALERA